MPSARRPLALAEFRATFGAGRIPGDEAAGEIVRADGSHQQCQVAIVPPSVEKERARCQPAGSGCLAQACSEEKSEDGKRQEEEEERVRIKKHKAPNDQEVLWKQGGYRTEIRKGRRDSLHFWKWASPETREISRGIGCRHSFGIGSGE